MWAELFLEGMKGHSNKGGRKILLGDNTGGGWGVVLPPGGFECAGVHILTGLPSLYAYNCQIINFIYKYS